LGTLKKKRFELDIDQGIYKVKLKVALNEKRKKFEVLCWNKKLSSNLFFQKSGVAYKDMMLKPSAQLLSEIHGIIILK